MDNLEADFLIECVGVPDVNGWVTVVRDDKGEVISLGRVVDDVGILSRQYRSE